MYVQVINKDDNEKKYEDKPCNTCTSFPFPNNDWVTKIHHLKVDKD